MWDVGACAVRLVLAVILYCSRYSLRQEAQSNPQLTSLAGENGASLASQLAPEIPHLCLPRLDLEVGCCAHRHLCGSLGDPNCSLLACTVSDLTAKSSSQPAFSISAYRIPFNLP